MGNWKITNSEHKEQPSEDITRLRLDLFSRKASEQSTVPLTSVLKLQYSRSCLVIDYWTNMMGINSREELERHVVENGWVKSRGGDVNMKLVDDTDNLYTYPRNIVKGCSCRKRPCKKCSCTGRGGCSVKVCKCNCFEHLTTDEASSFETEMSEEDLPEDFFEFDEDSDQLEDVLNEDNPLISSESKSELPDI